MLILIKRYVCTYTGDLLIENFFKQINPHETSSPIQSPVIDNILVKLVNITLSRAVMTLAGTLEVQVITVLASSKDVSFVLLRGEIFNRYLTFWGEVCKGANLYTLKLPRWPSPVHDGISRGMLPMRPMHVALSGPTRARNPAPPLVGIGTALCGHHSMNVSKAKQQTLAGAHPGACISPL